MAVSILIVYTYWEIFDCILPVYELEKHGWLCTYHIWLIWVCKSRLIVYVSYTIMRKFLIVFLPYMSLEDMVDCELTIYEWYEFVSMADCILIVYDYGGIFDCIFPVHELERHGWLCT